MAIVRRLWNIVTAWGIPWAVMLTVATSWLDDQRLGETANSCVYDRFVALDSRLAHVPSQVIIVYADDDLERQPSSYLELLERLGNLGAAGIGIIDVDLRSWSKPARQQLLDDRRVVLGHVRAASSLPAAALSSVDLVRSSDGICRAAWSRREGMADSIEATLAQRSASTTASREHLGQAYGVRFRGGVESLPHVHADAVLRGEVTTAMVRERFALIGRPPSAANPGVATPTTGDQRMPTLEFHGHALNTLLDGRPLYMLDSRISAMLFVLSALVFMTISRRVRLDRAIAMMFAAWTIQTAVVFALLWQTTIYVPLASLVFIEGVSAFWVFDRRMCFAERSWQMMRRRGFSVSPRYKSHPNLNADTEPWRAVAELIHQLFPVNCVSILVRQGTREHLRLAITTGCDDARIVERRRDLRRTPYADAIEHKGAVLVDQGQPFFERTGDDCQFIAPVLHGGSIRGFIVAELSQIALERFPSFPSQMTEACEEIAPWFARFEEIVVDRQRNSRWWVRWATSCEADTFEQLAKHLRSIERRLHQSFSVIENASIGKAVFDLSGQLLTMNASMFRTLHGHGLGSIDVKLLNVVRSFSKRDLFECRDLIRRTLMTGRRERVVASGPGDSNKPLVMVIQPLLKSAQMSDAREDMDAFNAHGVQIEIFEADLLGDVHHVREHVSDQGLDAIEHLLSDMLGMVEGTDASNESVRSLGRQLDYARQTVHRCQSMLANSESEEPDVRLPVQVDDLIRAAVADVQPLVEKHRATVSTSVASDLPDAMANPHRLREAISIVIQELVEHARESSLIYITARPWMDKIKITIENEGCGVALDRIAGLRGPSAERTQRDRSRLAQLNDWLVAWGGQLDITSALGEGALITLTLNRFKWGPNVDDLAADYDSACTPSD